MIDVVRDLMKLGSIRIGVFNGKWHITCWVRVSGDTFPVEVWEPNLIAGLRKLLELSKVEHNKMSKAINSPAQKEIENRFNYGASGTNLHQKQGR